MERKARKERKSHLFKLIRFANNSLAVLHWRYWSALPAKNVNFFENGRRSRKSSYNISPILLNVGMPPTLSGLLFKYIQDRISRKVACTIGIGCGEIGKN